MGDAERMSGYQVNDATVSINGSHILSTRTDGMIAVGMSDHEVQRGRLISYRRCSDDRQGAG